MKIIKNIGVMLLAICVLLVAQISQGIFEEMFSNYYLKLIIPSIICVIAAVLLAGVVSSKLLGISPEELGIKPKKIDIRLIILSILLPCAVLAFYAFALPGKPYVSKEGGSILATIVSGAFLAGIVPGFCEEVVFRGIIFRYMKKTLGVKAAVIIPAVLFAALHIMNMKTFDILDVTLLILAGSSVSVMFTFMALRSGSIYPGAIAHALWNTFIIGDIFGVGEIVNGSANTSYIIIPIESTSKLLTGGNFGVEAALPGTIGYIVVSVIVFFFIRSRDDESIGTTR